MPVATTPVLQKQQNKLPTSMRYERVQDILQSDLALKPLLGPRTHAIDSRFGEKIMFSKEAVDVTNAIHAEGKDAHKVSKSDVLKIAGRILKVIPTNGEARSAAPTPPAPVAAPEPAPVLSRKEQKPKPKPKASPKSKPDAPSATAPECQDQKPEPTGEAPASKSKKQAASKPAPKAETSKVAAKPAQPVKVPKQTKPKKGEAAKPLPVTTSKPPVADTANSEEGPDAVPESELPPERQPLHLPAAFDPKKYPHYDVQASIYSMLLSALTLSTHYERFPGAEDRQRKLELLLKDYLDTCNQIKIG